MRSFRRTLITFLLTILIGGIAVGACLAALIPGTVEIATAHHYTAKQVGELSALAQPSVVYYDDGTTELADFAAQARDPITTIDEVPKPVINAVIATEDRSFWTNDGIDLGAVFRAFVANVTSGRIEQGGSTITQQLVKNRILTSKRDVNRKIKEIEDALRLNEKFSKDKILVEYLNTVYFGSNSYGIKSAAERFFLVCDNGPVRAAGEDPRRAHHRRGRAPRRAHLQPRRQQPVQPPRPGDPSPRRRAARRGGTGLHHPGRGRRGQQRAAADGAPAGRDPSERLPRRRGAEQPARRPPHGRTPRRSGSTRSTRVGSRSSPPSTRACRGWRSTRPTTPSRRRATTGSRRWCRSIPAPGR